MCVIYVRLIVACTTSISLCRVVTSGTADFSNAHISGNTKLKFIAIAISFHGSAATLLNHIQVLTNANYY